MTYKLNGKWDARGFTSCCGVNSRFQEVTGEFKIKTNASQVKINELKKLVETKCPMADLFHGAGVVIKVDWIVVNPTNTGQKVEL